MIGNDCVLEIVYHKDAKNKVRSFYKEYYRLIQAFFEELENNDISSNYM
jgi:mRNA-degrading endonuclease RelE of RelBE toxin-antitoxin system